MKNYFNYDFINKAIVGSKAAINRANAGNTPEYRELTAKLAEHPDFKVIQKEINIKENKRKYNGLTLNRMENYILTQPHSEKMLEEFKLVKNIAQAKGAKYPITKKWFLEKYPEYKDSSTTVNDEFLNKESSEIKSVENETQEINKIAV